MNDKGWIKLHRDLLSKSIWVNATPEQKVILITILLLANHHENKWEFDGKIYECKPGQFVTSLSSLVEKCGKNITKQKLRTALSRFEALGFLTNESTKTGRLITVVNWERYQDCESEDNKADNKELTKLQQSDNKAITPNKNEKNERNIYYVINLFNSTCKSLPKVTKVSDKRKRMINKILKKYDVSELEAIFKMIEESSFLTGRKTDWKASFDWIMNESNIIKILDGNYSDKQSAYTEDELNRLWRIAQTAIGRGSVITQEEFTQLPEPIQTWFGSKGEIRSYGMMRTTELETSVKARFMREIKGIISSQ